MSAVLRPESTWSRMQERQAGLVANGMAMELWVTKAESALRAEGRPSRA
jgi:hypothetical protein